MKTSIDGVKGTLLFDLYEEPFLRIPWNNTQGFVDLSIRHNDLEVTLHGEGKIVIDETMMFYDGYVDHSDEVLGHD